MKTCTKCGETKSLTEFHKAASKKDGVMSVCKVCAKVRAAKYYQDNKETILERNAEWMENNSEKAKAKQAEWRRENRERCNEANNAWRAANRDKSNGYSAKWRAAHPEEQRQASLNWYRNNRERALATSAEWRASNPHKAWEQYYRLGCREFGITPVIESFTYDDVVNRYGDGCFYCDDGMFEALDHYHALAAGGEHTLDNVRPACAACNGHKQVKDRVLISVYRTVRAALAPLFDDEATA